MNQRSASDIERDLDRTRAEMSQTIDAIQDRLSPGQLFEQGLRYFSSGGGRSFADGATEFAQNFGRTIRDNPIPFALVTTGLAWLMLSRGRQRPDHDTYRDDGDYERLEGYRKYSNYPAVKEPVEEVWPAHYRDEDEMLDPIERERELADHPSAPGPISQAGGVPPYRSGLGGSVGAASVSKQRAQEAARQAQLESGTAEDDREKGMADRAREAASDARSRAGHAADEARRRAAHLGEEAREWAGETASGARERMYQTAEGTRRGFARASRSARRQAEETAYAARHHARRARSGLAHLFEERPLLVGAIGLAVGAALGAALPITRREDEWLGESRDDLKHRARDELGKAELVARRAYDTARSEAERQHLTPEGARQAARETVREAERAAAERVRGAVRDAEHVAEDKLRDVGSRMRKVGEAVTEAAKDEAERQHLAGTGGRLASGDTGGSSPRQTGEDPGQKQV
jgi:hypothetical protein